MTRLGDRAGTLLFFPAALLVMVVLAAVTVDLARLHLARREADDLAAATANDAVTVGLDTSVLRSGGGYRLDPTRVASLAAWAGDTDRSIPDLTVTARVTAVRSVAVTVRGRVPLGFGRVIPGAPRSVAVHAVARAKAHLR